MENTVQQEISKRFSDIYKKFIFGYDFCPFWRIDDFGTCVAFEKPFLCTADKNGSGCRVFPDSK